MTDRYAVVGHPVAHSLSPEIHAAFACQTGQDIEYIRLLAPLDAFDATMARFRAEGGQGVNVTAPFKFAAFRCCEPAASAMDAQAVNTIAFRGGKTLGYNTDGGGLVTDLERNRAFSIRDKRVLVMGAGGATAGIMHPVLQGCPKLLVIANRTLEKAAGLVARFGKIKKFAATAMTAAPYDALGGDKFDLVINATSAGLRDEMPPLPAEVFAAGSLAYDMVYGRQTPFMKFAQSAGVRTSDGLGMLVEQAAEAFFIWRGVRPDTRPVIANLWKPA
ncbi:MAG: shikimate dehydrogenase [Burkholderiales bacterium]